MALLKDLLSEDVKRSLSESYKDQVRKAMDIVGIDSPADLSDEEKKKFFSYIDTVWDAENDKVLNEPSKEDLKQIFPDLVD